MVVTKESPHKEVQSIGDIRELKGPAPPFIEVRFRPPPYDLRLFGRFVGQDSLVLTTSGAKGFNAKTGAKPLSVANERKRCDDAFAAAGLLLNFVPLDIKKSISNASFD
jgi:hypothetical protein